MSISVVLAVEDGRPVAVKRARDPGRADRLAREATLLESLRHPGVVELVRWQRDTDDAVLVTRFAGRSLTVSGPRPVDAIADLVTGLASTVADLHEQGLVHGRIDPSHVIVGSQGVPVLCGFSAAGRADEEVDGRRLDPSDDVVGLGMLLSDVLAEATGRARDIRSLRRLAEAAATDDPASRPTAAEFADRLNELMSADRGGDHLVQPASRVRRRARWPAITLAGGMVALLLAGTFALRRPGTASSPAAPKPPVACGTSTDGSVDIDGDGCADVVRIVDGVLEVGDRRYAAGAPGDQVAIGDWDCDGQATPALLRPTTGEVFVFPRWTGPGGRVVVSATTSVTGAEELHPVQEPGEDCPVLVVERADGSTVTVAR